MSRRKGIALVLVIVVLLLTEAMAAGMLVLASHARLAGAAQVRTTRAEWAARFAAHSVLADWESLRADTLAPGAVRRVALPVTTEADARWTADIERLQSAFLVRAEARVGGGNAYSAAHVTAVARMLDVAGELDPGITSGGTLAMTGSAALIEDTMCLALLPPAIATARNALIDPTVTVGGAIVLDSALAWPDSTALGNASWGDIAAIADRIEAGVVVAGPVISSGTCDTTALANWGEPADPASPCASYAPLIYAPGDLTMAGGRAQGVVIAAGTFEMTGAARFTGAIIARDGVTIEQNSLLTGAALSRRGFVLVQDAMVARSPCSLQRIFAAARAGRRLLPERRRFLPDF